MPLNPENCNHPSAYVTPSEIAPRYGYCRLCESQIDRRGRFLVGDTVAVSAEAAQRIGRRYQPVAGVVERVLRRYQGQIMYAMRIPGIEKRHWVSHERVVSVAERDLQPHSPGAPLPHQPGL